MKFQEKILVNNIEKIKPVIANKNENIEAVKKRVGCDYVINFGTYNFSDMKPDSGLKIDNVLIKTGYTCEGFGIKQNELIWSYEGQGFTDWIGQWSSYYKNGVLYNAPKNDKNAQIGIGVNRNNEIVIAGTSKDEPLTSYEFMTKYFKDCLYAIKGDGSYSSQWITPETKNVTTRKVLWYLCIWLKQDKQDKGGEDMDIKVKCSKKTNVFDESGSKIEGYIDKNDICTINGITKNCLITITYPTSNGTKTRWIKSLENFTQA
jgi:hypothetical protein